MASTKLCTPRRLVSSARDTLRLVGGAVKLGNMNRQDMNGVWLHVHGIELFANGETKLQLRKCSATGTRSYDGEYVMVHADRVVQTRPHAYAAKLLATDEELLRDLVDAGLDPLTLKSPEYILDEQLCDGFQGYNNRLHAKRHGLKPIWGYIIKADTGPNGGLSAYFHSAYETKAGVIYVPLESNGIASISGSTAKAFFVTEPAVPADFEEKMKSSLSMWFPEQSDQINSTVLISPFRHTSRPPTIDNVARWAQTQFLPMTKSFNSEEAARAYYEMRDSVAVVDRSMAVQMVEEFSNVANGRNQNEWYSTEQYIPYMQMHNSAAQAFRSPCMRAKECCHCKCIALDYWVADADDGLPANAEVEEGSLAVYCSPECRVVAGLGFVKVGPHAPADVKAHIAEVQKDYVLQQVVVDFFTHFTLIRDHGQEPAFQEKIAKRLRACEEWELHPRWEQIKPKLRAVVLHLTDGTPMPNLSRPPPPVAVPVAVPMAVPVAVPAPPADVREAALAAQAATRNASRERYEALVKKHDEREALAAAERRLQELERRLQIADERERSSAQKERDLAQRVADAAPKPQPGSKKKGKVKGKQAARADALAASVHTVHVSDEQSAFRERDFNAKQAREHLNAEIRKAMHLVEVEKEKLATKHRVDAVRDAAPVPKAATVWDFVPKQADGV